MNERTFVKNFCLTCEICRCLIDELAQHDNQKTSLQLIVSVLAALNFLGHGLYQKCVGNNVHLPISQSCLSRSLRAVAELIVKVKEGELRIPSSIEEENLEYRAQLSVLILLFLLHHQILYLNRKGFYSINVEAVSFVVYTHEAEAIY